MRFIIINPKPQRIDSLSLHPSLPLFIFNCFSLSPSTPFSYPPPPHIVFLSSFLHSFPLPFHVLFRFFLVLCPPPTSFSRSAPSLLTLSLPLFLALSTPLLSNSAPSTPLLVLFRHLSHIFSPPPILHTPPHPLLHFKPSFHKINFFPPIWQQNFGSFL